MTCGEPTKCFRFWYHPGRIEPPIRLPIDGTMTTILPELSLATPDVPTVLTVGVFDGVHLGHRRLLQRVVAAARAQEARAAVLTFYPHPAEVLRGLSGRYYLATLDERVAALRDTGVDLIITQPFTEETRHMRAAAFVDALRRHLDMRALWGAEFHLGYRREGDFDFLSGQGAAKGFTVHLVDERVIVDGERVSSTRIRRALAAGRVAEAGRLLGRPYALTGVVVTGARRGRTIGFPTANLAVWEKSCLPAYGVYAAHATVDGVTYPAATNVGVRPTVNGTHESVEAHLLDFDGDLYDKTVRLSFLHHIRPERKFDGIDALKAQITVDVALVRQLLAA